MNVITNPWLSITPENIAACDKLFFDSNGSLYDYEELINSGKRKVELTFSCLPDPFCGNPNSKVYCLNKNPGKPDPCFDNDVAYRDATIKNLQLEQDSCFWAENIRNKCGKLHAGIDWLAMRTKQLKTILGRHPNIFFVEFFPYHSTYGFDFPGCLPSYEFSNNLIMQAMEEGKTIIIMREKNKWLKRIASLASYPNLYVLKYAQGGYLTKNNIIKYDTGQNLTDDEIKALF